MYRSLVRLSYYTKHFDRVEIVQHHFFRIVLTKLGFPDHIINRDYKALGGHVKIPTLQSLRMIYYFRI